MAFTEVFTKVAGDTTVTTGKNVVVNDVDPETYAGYMDDGGVSNNIARDMVRDLSRTDRENVIFTPNNVNNNNNTVFELIKNHYGLRSRNDIDIFTRRYRFGLFNPYENLSKTKQFVFFTKPDLYIMKYESEDSDVASSTQLRDELANRPFWQELLAKYPEVIYNLQSSCQPTSQLPNDPFNHLLGNMVRSNVDVPSLSAETIDTPTNMHGVGYSYRGSSEAGNDNFEFSLEFADTRYLPVYMYFRAYEEYQMLKHHGVIGPRKKYIANKVLHDQIAVYKFLVDEDMESIVYYSKYFGVMPTSLPRDTFSSSDFGDGLSFSVSFKSAFFEDMDPLILSDFNAVGQLAWDASQYRVDIYNDILNRVDNRPCTSARIMAYRSDIAPGGYLYKLKWRGRDTA